MLLTMKEINRLRVLQGDMDGKILIREAARILERSLRSVYRMLAMVREKATKVSKGERDFLRVHQGFVDTRNEVTV